MGAGFSVVFVLRWTLEELLVKVERRKFGVEARGGKGRQRQGEGSFCLLLFRRDAGFCCCFFCLVVGDGGGAGVSGGFWCCCCPLFVVVLWRMFLVLAVFSGRSFLVDCSVLCFCKLILFLVTTC